jgi:hypothetical protein
VTRVGSNTTQTVARSTGTGWRDFDEGTLRSIEVSFAALMTVQPNDSMQVYRHAVAMTGELVAEEQPSYSAEEQCSS